MNGHNPNNRATGEKSAIPPYQNGCHVVVAQNQPPVAYYAPAQPFRKKSIIEAYLLAILLGLLGAHHFYLRRPLFGILYFFTFGLCGCGYVFDLFRLPCLVRDTNRMIAEPSTAPKKKRLDDAYALWLPPFGFLGFHHFYLRNYGLGALYMFTCGLFGIGWLLDMCLLPRHFKNTNKNIDRDERYVWEAYIFAFSPIGLLGAQHFYLGRIVNGLLYFFTFGLFGAGYIYDWFRVPCLVKRRNQSHFEGDSGRKYLDDAYILWFPLGFLGLHHFYLKRYGWGFLYFFTFGLFGLGWLIDFCRMPFLVKEYNRSIEERKLIPTHQTVPTSPPDYGHPTEPIMTSPQAPPGYGQYPSYHHDYQSTNASQQHLPHSNVYPNPDIHNTNVTVPPPPPHTYGYPNQGYQGPMAHSENPPPYTPADPNISSDAGPLPRKS